ncbi:MAG TPA: hypothetical protein PKD19_03935 [Candidatus Saccharibacteria bacterium]|nr:hypothetical protein [Candidatus Saccharibacteria bacterium]HMR38680.1 hypothetical protein [Candidatus Saccharibacteria bacterium]
MTKKTKKTTAITPPKRKTRVSWLVRFREWRNDLLSRRPHRSFQLTKRRDYRRSLKLPGYFAFTKEVLATLNKYRKPFVLLIATYGVFGILFGSMTSQDTFTQINDLLKDGSGSLFEGGLGSIAEAGLLAVASFTGDQGVSEEQRVYLAIFLLITWMTTVWLLREYLAGRKPSLRDGLYNASAPLVSTLIVGLIVMLQFIPFGIMLIAQSALGSVGISLDGFGGMLFYILMALVSALSLYWMTASFIALVIVTLPGMYPIRAIKAAGNLVIGRRLRILYRLLWAFGVVVITWVVTVVPLVMITGSIGNTFEGLKSVPIVPFFVVFLSAATVVWLCAYIYLLYRKVVEDDASPS